MTVVVTVAERRERAAARRRAAIGAVVAELRDYAAREGGRYLLFGSAAKGMVNEHSDLDVIIDFPATRRQDAFMFVEDACFRHGVPCDVQDMPSTKSPFLRRIRDHAVVLP